MHDDDHKTRPLAVGLILTSDRAPEEVEDLKVSIAAKAIREGFSLLSIFEAKAVNYSVILEQLLVSVRAARAAMDNPRAVLIPTQSDLGASGSARIQTMERLDENDLLVMVLQ